MKVWDCVQKTLLLYQSKSTIYHMKRLLLSLLLLLMLSFMKAFALQTPLTFYRLGIRDGLSNSQINSVFKDSKGYIWFGTASGLDRFDGFRFSRPQLCSKDILNFIKRLPLGFLPNKTPARI